MAKAKASTVVMTPGQLMYALQQRYPAREYALLEQVRNGTGYGRTVRTADAIALSLWPSRGLVLHGFEIKNYRGDWIREKDKPEKAEEIARFCDYWWLVVTRADIVHEGELPATWGLLAPDETGTKLVAVQQPTKMEAQPWSRAFMAAVLRTAADSMVPKSAVDAQVEEARQAGFAQGKGAAPANEAERELKDLRELKTRVEAFERASGHEIHLQHGWGDPVEIGKAVAAVLSTRRQYTRFIETLKSAAQSVGNGAAFQLEHLKREAETVQRSLQTHLEEIGRLQGHDAGDASEDSHVGV